MNHTVPRPASRHPRRASPALLVGVAALLALWSAPAARATYPGANGRLAYESLTTNGSQTVIDQISSIPLSSAANCQPGATGTTDCSIGRIAYSPDGRTIVAGRRGRLELVEANGTHVRILTRQTGYDEAPAFLPNGQTIVFAGRAGHRTNLYEVGVDGTHLRQLTTRGGSWPAPCASGEIAFVGRHGLYIIRAGGTRMHRLVAGSFTRPDCAPNSRRILYGTLRGDATISVKGGAPTTMRGVGGGENAVYSPDGRFIAFERRVYEQGDLIEQLVVLRIGGRIIRRSEVGDGQVTSAGSLAWQPLHG